MKRAYRRAHLLIWLVLAPLLVAAFVLSLSVRRDTPIEPQAAPEMLSNYGGSQ